MCCSAVIWLCYVVLWAPCTTFSLATACTTHRTWPLTASVSSMMPFGNYHFVFNILDNCHLLSTSVGYSWLLWLLLPCLTHLHTPCMFCNLDAQLYSWSYYSHSDAWPQFWSFLYPYSKATEVLPSGNAVLYCRSSAQLFVLPQVVHHRQHSLS